MLQMLLRAACSERSQRALCVAAVLVLMAMPRALEGCCCRDRSHGGGDSSAASSEEDAVGSEDARVQRCVRTAAPGLLVDGTYTHVARVDACASRGLDALASGAPAADAADAVSQCVDGQPFPPGVAPVVADFEACVRRALT